MAPPERKSRYQEFDREIGDYFRSHYRRVASLTPSGTWRADVWERTAPFK